MFNISSHQRSSHNSYTEAEPHSNHKKKLITNPDKDADQTGHFDTASENVSQCNCYGNPCGSSSKILNLDLLYDQLFLF